jgi:hypothetical protein
MKFAFAVFSMIFVVFIGCSGGENKVEDTGMQDDGANAWDDGANAGDDSVMQTDDTATAADDAVVQADDGIVQTDDGAVDDGMLITDHGVEDVAIDIAENVAEDFSPPSDIDAGTDITDIFEINEGGFLWECSTGSECKSGLCVEYMGKKVCTVECIEQCPFEWVCKEIVTATFCLSPLSYLCKPCEMSSDCVTPQGMESVCVKYDGNASFCGIFCDTDKNCPEGYECKKTKAVEGGEFKVCRNKEGLCECTELYEGTKSSCGIGNEYGVCEGNRECKDKKWTACSGEVPSKETCDGADNNCNGNTDENLSNCCVCGNKICESFCGEDIKTCLTDCAVCGNGKCEPGEGPVACPQDCCGTCGDKICANYPNCTENADNCALDCGATACGNLICEKGENPTNCPADCGKFACGNGVCEPGEDVNSCPSDCGTFCGNCECEGGEDYQNCPVDCGYCGDGYCSPCPSLNENTTTCFKDCCKAEEEKCDGKDNDCDGYVDEEDADGCEKYYFDYDGDGYGVETVFKCLCKDMGYFKTKLKGDCNDFDATINPSVENNGVEKCDGKDNDCDGKTD